MAMYSYASSPVPNGWRTQTLRSIGDVPTAVGNLLVATKGLEAALRQWGEQRVSENEVSDTYVVVGTEFNNMITAFAQHQIDLSEIHAVPTDLRNVLESCLGEEPSPHALAEYMPDVRQIVWDLLWALRAKRDLWKRAAGAPVAVSAVSAGGRGYL